MRPGSISSNPGGNTPTPLQSSNVCSDRTTRHRHVLPPCVSASNTLGGRTLDLARTLGHQAPHRPETDTQTVIGLIGREPPIQRFGYNYYRQPVG